MTARQLSLFATFIWAIGCEPSLSFEWATAEEVSDPADPVSVFAGGSVPSASSADTLFPPTGGEPSSVRIPRSDTCNVGARLPLECVTVQPLQQEPPEIDGLQSQREYWGATELPLSAAQATDARIALAVDPNREELFIAIRDLLPVQDSLDHQETFRILLDFDRFADGPGALSAEDRVIYVSRAEGRAWMAAPSSATPQFSAEELEVESACASDRCFIEMNVPLPSLVSPTDGSLPGFGFGVVAGDAHGYAQPAALRGADTDGEFDRTLLSTVLVGRAQGIPLSIMSWNVAHWGSEIEWSLTGSPFSEHRLSDLAALIAPHDIVALQEMWNEEDAHRLRDEVNARRAVEGAAPMELLGPVHGPNSIIEHLDTAGAFGEPHAGLFVLSRFPAVERGQTIFSECRGEDCLKPKGVQWVRLQISAEEQPGCEGNERKPESACPIRDTGEMFLDVFNTHLQAANPSLCSDPDSLVVAREGILAWCHSRPELAPFCLPLRAATEELTTSCTKSHEEVRESQLSEMMELAEAARQDAWMQPIVYLGDFNVDGRIVEGDEARDYRWLLDRMGLRDLPEQLEGLIHHPDVALAAERYDWKRCGHGTLVGSGALPADSPGSRELSRLPHADGEPSMLALECPAWSCDQAGEDGVRDRRLDYVFAEQSPLDALSPTSPPYLLMQSETLPAWEPLWPAATAPETHVCANAWGINTQGEIGTKRLSDHRPIVSHLELVPFRFPREPRLSEGDEVRVVITSADVSGESDCALSSCGYQDPYLVRVTSEHGRRRCRESCHQEDHPGVLMRGLHGCMDDWTHTFSSESSPEVRMELWDDDGVAVNDPIPTIESHHPHFVIDWSAGTVSVFGDGHHPLPGWQDRPLTEDPLRGCTQNQSPSLCFRVEIVHP